MVRCPACRGRAVVGPDPGAAPWRAARLTCKRCGHARSAALDGARWAGPVWLSVRGRCGRCGRGVARDLGRRPRRPAARTGRARCPGCGHVTALPLQLSPSTGRGPADPYFGLPLWYQAPCAGHTVWAWNEAHLAYLRNYVGAGLREREPNRNASLPSRLPSWLKAAKHRGAVLAALAGLSAA